MSISWFSIRWTSPESKRSIMFYQISTSWIGGRFRQFSVDGMVPTCSNMVNIAWPQYQSQQENTTCWVVCPPLLLPTIAQSDSWAMSAMWHFPPHRGCEGRFASASRTKTIVQASVPTSVPQDADITDLRKAVKPEAKMVTHHGSWWMWRNILTIPNHPKLAWRSPKGRRFGSWPGAPRRAIPRSKEIQWSGTKDG